MCRKNMSIIFSLLGAALAVVLYVFCSILALAVFLERVVSVTRAGLLVFHSGLAGTSVKRPTGHMHRKELAPGLGMLFDFEREGPISMWMKNTYVSLDMIFIRGDGRIARIAENTTPLSEAVIPSGGSVTAVLEVVAGTARRLGIAPGDRVAHRIFRKR